MAIIAIHPPPIQPSHKPLGFIVWLSPREARPSRGEWSIPTRKDFFNTSLSGGKGDAPGEGFFHNPDLL